MAALGQASPTALVIETRYASNNRPKYQAKLCVPKQEAHGKGNLPVGFDCLSAWGYPDSETIAAPGGRPGGQLVDDAAASLTFCAACFMLF